MYNFKFVTKFFLKPANKPKNVEYFAKLSNYADPSKLPTDKNILRKSSISKKFCVRRINVILNYQSRS